jgi:hypothetical protein
MRRYFRKKIERRKQQLHHPKNSSPMSFILKNLARMTAGRYADVPFDCTHSSIG